MYVKYLHKCQAQRKCSTESSCGGTRMYVTFFSSLSLCKPRLLLIAFAAFLPTFRLHPKHPWATEGLPQVQLEDDCTVTAHRGTSRKPWLHRQPFRTAQRALFLILHSGYFNSFIHSTSLILLAFYLSLADCLPQPLR